MREKMVTRTIATANVEVMVCDVNTASTDTIMVTTKPMTDHNKLLKRIKKDVETESLKVVAIVSYEEEEKLYGMTESQFIEMAKVLPPRQAKDNEVSM